MERLVAAVRAGDVDQVSALLRQVADADLGGELGSTLLREAAVTGRAEMVDYLVSCGADPNRVWPGGVEPVCWFAERGAWHLLLTIMPYQGSPSSWPSIPASTLRAALDLARAWLDDDPEQRLRRRLDPGADPATVVERERVPAWHHGGPTAVRIRVRTADGRHDQVWAAHRAVVTLLEEHLGIITPNDDLAERATHTADPDSWDSEQAHGTLARRAEHDAEVFDWLAARLTHPAAGHRRFAAELLHGLSFSERPFDAPAADILAGRIRDEPDPAVLDSLIGAFAEYAYRARPGTDLPEILPHARHRDPSVRARVAMELVAATGSRRDLVAPNPAGPPPPAVVTALLDLTADADPDTRTAALQVLAYAPLDTADVHAVLAGHLSDPHPPARVQAAAGLVLRGDVRGRETLTLLQADPGVGDIAHWRLIDLDRLLAPRPDHVAEPAGRLSSRERRGGTASEEPL